MGVKKRIPWNKGKKGVQVAWNKGKKGVQVGWSKGLTKETDVRVRKRGEARIGIKHSEKSKRKMSVTKKKLFASGYVHPMKGTKLSPERRREMSLARKGKKYAPGRVHHFKGKKLSPGHRKNISSGLKGHITTPITRKRIGVKNKITTKRFWKSMTESQKQKTGASKTWFTKGQAPHNKGKKPILKTRKRMSASATLRFQTQKHPMEGKRHDKATRKLIREKRLKQKPMKNTVPEKLMRKMLKDLGIRFEEQIGIKEPACQPDFFIQPNILIFSDGDYIHANPNPFLLPRSSKIHPGYKDDAKYFRNKTMKDKRRQDQRITRGLKKEGYKVLRFWQSELENNREKCLQEIIEAIKESKRI